MTLQELSREEDGLVRKFDYDDETVYAVEIGNADAEVDVVGDTAIVVVDGQEYDVQVSEGADVQAFIRNGVLTIEVTER